MNALAGYRTGWLPAESHMGINNIASDYSEPRVGRWGGQEVGKNSKEMNCLFLALQVSIYALRHLMPTQVEKKSK